MLAAIGTALAAIVVGSLSASKGTPQGCVDYNNQVVSDERCVEQEKAAGSHVYSSYHYPYRWHYGGSSYRIGSAPKGGSFSRPGEMNFYRPNSPSTTTRGIFGSSGAHFGGGYS